MDEELKRLRQVAPIYGSEALAGANEQYHLYLRDLVIPGEGGRSALELGCGKGLWTDALCDRYDAVDVVEASDELRAQVVARCRGRRAKLTPHAGLVEDFAPAEGQTWQHVYMTFLLEHLADPVAALRRISHWLDEDGSLFLAVPNANSVHRVIAARMGLIRTVDELSDNDKRVGHRRVYTPELLRSQVEQAGLAVAEARPIGLKVVSLKQMAGWSAAMVQGFCASGDLAPANPAYIAMRVAHA